MEAWGRPTFRAGRKIFAVYTDGADGEPAVVFKPEPDEREALLADGRFFVPPYFGPGGWLAVRLGSDVDRAELAELVEGSYRQVALKRMLAALDGG